MKSIILSLLFVALLVAAQSSNTSKVPNYYYDTEASSFAYCTSADNTKTGCACTEANMIYVNGYCVSNDDEHMCDNLKPSMTTQTSCGDFGSTVNYCSATADNEVALVSSEGCFKNDDVEYGVGAIYTKIAFTNMPVFGITAGAKAKIISALVASFPFMISDVEFGAVYLSSESTIDSAPTTIVEARIITRINYIPSFEAAEDNVNENSPATVFTDYLHTYADTMFSPCVEATFESVEGFKHDVTCFNENDRSFSLGEYEYKSCMADLAGAEVYSYSSRVCMAENGGTWSEPNTSTCIDTSKLEGKEYAVINIDLKNVPYSLMNSNMTKALYPIFIKYASTDLRDIYILSVHPFFDTKYDESTIDISSTGLILVMTMENDCMQYDNSAYKCSRVIHDKLSREDTQALLTEEIKAIDSSLFKDLQASYDIYTD